MKPMKLLVKDLEQFMQSERVMYATADNKRFFISIHAGPNYPRYTIQNMKTKEETGYTNKSKAIKAFNEMVVP